MFTLETLDSARARNANHLRRDRRHRQLRRRQPTSLSPTPTAPPPPCASPSKTPTPHPKRSATSAPTGPAPWSTTPPKPRHPPGLRSARVKDSRQLHQIPARPLHRSQRSPRSPGHHPRPEGQSPSPPTPASTQVDPAIEPRHHPRRPPPGLSEASPLELPGLRGLNAVLAIRPNRIIRRKNSLTRAGVGLPSISKAALKA